MDTGRFLSLFVSESREHLGSAYELLARLEAGAGDAAAIRGLQRHFHSLKGMAASIGCDGIVEIAHAAEGMLTHLLDRPAAEAVDHVRPIGDGLECIGGLVDAMEGGAAADEERAASVARSLLAARCWELRIELGAEAAGSAAAATRMIRDLPRLGAVRRVRPPRLESLLPGRDEPLRVEVESIRSQAELERLAATIPGVRRVVASLRPAVKRPVAVGETVPGWVRVRAGLLDDLLARTYHLMLHTPRDIRVGELYRTVKQLRLTPLDVLFHRLHRAARELARSLDKPFRFRTEGGEVELDRTLVDGLLDPLLHLLRNAADHGLERPAARAAAGKPELGEIVLEVARSRDRVELTLRDDGRGIDPRAIADAAVQQGLIGRRVARRLDGRRALSLLTLPGFSTSAEVDRVSGRGVGLDAVRAGVQRLGGRLTIESEADRGTAFRLVLPLSLALIRALMVRCGGELFAIPARNVREARRVRGAGAVLVRLDEHLGFPPGAANGTGPAELVVLDRPGDELGVVVDEILGTREILVKPLAGGPSDHELYTGAALLEEGGIALVVDAGAIRPA